MNKRRSKWVNSRSLKSKIQIFSKATDMNHMHIMNRSIYCVTVFEMTRCKCWILLKLVMMMIMMWGWLKINFHKESVLIMQTENFILIITKSRFPNKTQNYLNYLKEEFFIFLQKWRCNSHLESNYVEHISIFICLTHKCGGAEGKQTLHLQNAKWFSGNWKKMKNL